MNTCETQGELNFAAPLNITVDPREAPRLGKQQQAILERLQAGSATNVELARIGIRYSARIGELRSAGYRIEIVARDFDSGLVTYKLCGVPLDG